MFDTLYTSVQYTKVALIHKLLFLWWISDVVTATWNSIVLWAAYTTLCCQHFVRERRAHSSSTYGPRGLSLLPEFNDMWSESCLLIINSSRSSIQSLLTTLAHIYLYIQMCTWFAFLLWFSSLLFVCFKNCRLFSLWQSLAHILLTFQLLWVSFFKVYTNNRAIDVINTYSYWCGGMWSTMYSRVVQI